MIKAKALVAAWIGCTLLSVPAQAETISLAPHSSWSLDYAEDSCALRRAFGSEDNQTWLEIRQFTPGVRFRVTVATAQSDRRRGGYPMITFLPGGTRMPYRLAAFGDYGDGLESVATYQWLPHSGTGVMYEIPESERTVTLPDSSQIDRLLIENTFDDDLELNTGSLGEPISALAACSDDLMAHMGAVHPANLSRQAVPVNEEQWSAPIRDSYPRRMLRYNIEGRIFLRVLIDATGAPQSCMVQEPVVDEDYQAFVCGVVMEHGEFEPALGPDGEPVQSIYNQAVVYHIERRR